MAGPTLTLMRAARSHLAFTTLLLAAIAGCSGEVISGPAPAPDPAPAPGPDPAPAPGPLACSIAAPDDPGAIVLAWARGVELVLVRADGSSFVAHTFEGTPSAGSGIQVVARDGFVAAIHGGWDPDSTPIGEAVLL